MRVVLLLLCVTPTLAGDEEVARFLFGKAERAYRAAQYEDAEKDFRRAIKEHAPFPEASYALGQTLEKLDRLQEAVVAYQQCVDAASADDPPRRWKSIAVRAGKAIGRLRRRFAALDRLTQDFVQQLLEFGRRSSKSDPAWARSAFEAVLKLDPGNQSARNRLAGLTVATAKPAAKPKATAGARGKSLITPDDFSAWDPGEAADWHLAGSVITGDVDSRHGKINWLDDLEIEGKYSVRFRFRVLEDRRVQRTVGLFVGDAKDAWWCIMLDENNELVLVRYFRGQSTPRDKRPIRDLDLRKWQDIRLEVRGLEAKVYFNDKLLIEMSARKDQPFEGKLGLFVQNAKVEFKDLELKQ